MHNYNIMSFVRSLTSYCRPGIFIYDSGVGHIFSVVQLRNPYKTFSNLKSGLFLRHFIQIEVLFTNPGHVFRQSFSEKATVCVPLRVHCWTHNVLEEHIPHIGLQCQNQTPTMQLDLRRLDFISIVLFSLRPVSW